MFRRRTVYRILFAISALYVVYATTAPWRLTWPPDWSDWDDWVPVWDPEDGAFRSIPDMLQNVLLFLPVGFLGWLAVRRTRSVVLLALGLSIAAELLQTMLRWRTSATTDIVMNTLGAYAGARAAARLAGPFEDRLLPRLLGLAGERPGSLPLFALTGAVVWRALEPFFPRLDIGAIVAGARPFLEDPWGPRAPELLAFDVLLYAGLAVLWLRETRTRLPLWILAALLELAQFSFFGHTPHLQDLAAAWAGIAVGSLVARRTGPGPAREAGELSRRRPLLAYGFALGLILLHGLEPFRLVAWRAPEPRAFVPFATALAPVTRDSVAGLFAALGVHLPLAHVLLVRGAGGPAAAVTCGGLALLLEVCQLRIEGGSPDVTDVLLAAAAVPLVARAHSAFQGLGGRSVDARARGPSGPGSDAPARDS